MDCCNYGQYGAGAAWEGYGAGAGYPAPYASYSHGYYAHAHDPYARYYRYDYQPHHMHHAEHAMPMDYGAYAAKEARARRAIARRDRASTPAQHLPLPPTPPLEIGMNVRGPAYGDPQMWSPHYQMGAMNGAWNGGHAPVNSGWSRTSCSREHLRYPSDCRQAKAHHMPAQNSICQQDGKLTPYPVYEDQPSNYNRENPARHGNSQEFPPAMVQQENARNVKERYYPEPRQSPPAEKRPPVVPLPAFQQAFGSTEIGKFAEAFSRTEVAQDDASSENFLYDSYSEWDGPTEPQWSTQPPAPAREIKCEDNY